MVRSNHLIAGGAAFLLLLLLAGGRRDVSTSLMQKTGGMPQLSMLEETNMVSCFITVYEYNRAVQYLAASKDRQRRTGTRADLCRAPPFPPAAEFLPLSLPSPREHCNWTDFLNPPLVPLLPLLPLLTLSLFSLSLSSSPCTSGFSTSRRPRPRKTTMR